MNSPLRRARGPSRLLGVTLACALAAPLAAQAPRPRVAMVLDQDSLRFQPLVEAIRKEILSFVRPGEIELLQPLSGDGTVAGVSALLTRAFDDRSVTAVVTSAD